MSSTSGESRQLTRSAPASAAFIVASMSISGGTVFVLSQILFVIWTGGDLSFWGFPLMGSLMLAVTVGAGVLLGGGAVLRAGSRRASPRPVAPMLVASVSAVLAGAGICGLLVLFRIPQLWLVALGCAVVTGVVVWVCAAVVRPAAR